MGRRKHERKLVGKRVVDGREYVVWRYEPDEVAVAVGQRTHPGQNSFDQSYQKGRFPMWFRRIGEPPVWDPDDPATMRVVQWQAQDEEKTVLIRGTQHRPAAEEPYVQSLHEFFEERIAMWPATATQREWLRIVMLDTRSTRDIGEDFGVTHAAVVLGRQRAVESFVKYMGGKAALAEKLRTYLHAAELADGMDRLKFLPRWVHG